MYRIVVLTVCVLFICMKDIRSLKVIPERAIVTYINEKYLYKNGTIYIKRYGRKSGYTINLEGTTKMPFGNNVSIHLVFFEYLHNEYKRSFVEMHFKLCDMYKSDPYLGGALRTIDFTCPVPVGVQRLLNLTVPADEFPNVWPFEKCKVAASLVQSPTNDIIASADVYVLFKQKARF